MQKFNHGGREDTGLVHVAALLTGLLFFMRRTCVDMTMIERMVAAGMSKDCAAETAMWYMAQGDDDGLEAYVIALEALNKPEARHGIRALQS